MYFPRARLTLIGLLLCNGSVVIFNGTVLISSDVTMVPIFVVNPVGISVWS